MILAAGATPFDQMQGESYWRPRETRATDLTAVVHLAHPNCDS
jgi:hypothetical protein